MDIEQFIKSHKLRPTIYDARLKSWLGEITPLRKGPLVRRRAAFRALIRARPIVGLLRMVGKPDVPAGISLQIAIWLLGRCGTKSARPLLYELYRRNPPAPIRKEITRALRRIGAGPELRAIATQEAAGSHVAWLAKPYATRPWSERLSRYLRTAETSIERDFSTAISPTPFVASEELGPGRPAKSPDFIRRLLERIRSLVRGDSPSSQ